eukprot:154289_1
MVLKIEPKLLQPAIDVKILYFPFGGRGSALRLAAFIGNLRFEDEFISFEEFRSIKQEYKIRWCTLPQIIIYDTNHNQISTIGQSNTCLRYIGWKCNLYPTCQIHAANCDEIMDYIEDMMLLLAPSEFCGDENEKKKLRKELSEHELLIWLQKLEWRLNENINKGYKNGYIIGDEFTIADCKLYNFIRHFGRCQWREGYYKYINENILDTFPLLKQYKTFIGNKEIIKEFNRLWRIRHKGFKLKDSRYSQCFIWNKHNYQIKTDNNIQKNINEEYICPLFISEIGKKLNILWDQCKHKTNLVVIDNESYDIDKNMLFIIAAIILLFIYLITNEPCIPLFGLIISLGIEDKSELKCSSS